MDNLLEGILHVFRLFYFVVAPFIVETQNRDTPFIYSVGIYFAVIVFTRYRLTTACHTKGSTIEISVVIFQGSAIAPGRLLLSIASRIASVYTFNAKTKSVAGHAHTSAVFDMIPSREIKLLVIQPPRRVYMHSSNAIFIVTFPSCEFRQESRHRCASGIVQILPDYVARIR